MSKKSYHVIPSPNGGWSVRKSGAERATKHFDKKEDAIKCGRDLSKSQGTDLFVHGKDGTVRARDSYGQDTYPPREDQSHK